MACQGKRGAVLIPATSSAIASLPLVFHNQRATIDRDPQILASRLAQHYALLDFGPRLGLEKQFLHRSSSAAAGDLLLTCGYTSPIQGMVGENPGVGSLNLCFAGSTTYQVDGLSLQISPEQPLFFAPGQEYRYSVDHFNGMAFHLDLQRLRATAAGMAGLGISERRFSPDLTTARVPSFHCGHNARLLQLLRRSFSLLDDATLESSGYLQHLQVDDLIYRTLALLLFPKLGRLLDEKHQDDSVGRRRILEELLEWIHANLHRPIQLSQLEQRSGYSRRHLQMAFQQRYGCGPIQWIRQQRLEQARQALLHPDPNDTVTAIASRQGYSSLAAFSRDFHAVYGLRPSDLLREGRRHLANQLLGPPARPDPPRNTRNM